MNPTQRSNRLPLASLAILASAVAIPATIGFAAETTSVSPVTSTASPVLAYDIADTAPLSFSPAAAKQAMIEGEGAKTIQADQATQTEPKTKLAADEADTELECMAKVVHHEAANQSREGQLAVAQLMMNRLESGRFADTICGIAHQPGQFFNTRTYNPRRDTALWRTAMEVSREAMAGEAKDIVPGAFFYHAAYQKATAFFRTRQRIVTLGDHIFYR